MANYSSTCTPTSNPAGPIPSDSTVDSDVYLGLSIAEDALVPLNYACWTVDTVLGEGSNLAFCVVAGVAAEAVEVTKVSLEDVEFCDVPVLGAENDAAYANTIAIFNNLVNDTIGINNNINNVDTDIDTRVAATDLDIDTRLANVDTDLNNHLTAVNNDVNAQGNTGNTNQALDLRVEIERSLASGLNVGLFQTPKAQGGYLELVGTIVETVINGLAAAGQSVGNAQTLMNQGHTAYGAKSYKKAYSYYMKAYAVATLARLD